MENITDDFDNEVSDINEGNLLTKIWLKPTATLKYITKYCPEKYVIVFLVMGGIVRSIDRASMKDMGDNMPTLPVLLIAIIVGGLFGWITYYIYAWAMSGTGKWMKGKADPSEFRTIIAWALVPSICSLILLIPELIIFGDDLFRSNPVNTSTFNDVMWVVFGIIETTLGLWTLVIMVKGIALIQDFKIGKSILNMLLPGLVIIVPILLIAFLYKIM